MQLKLVTVAFDPEVGAFPSEPLNSIEGEIVSVVEHFFQFNDLPHLLLIVHYRSGKEHKAAKRHIADSLSDDDRELYQQLAAWRRSRANAEGVPVYVIFNNRHLAQLARQRPRSRREIRDTHGVGEVKANRYGDDILKIVASFLQQTDSSVRSQDESK